MNIRVSNVIAIENPTADVIMWCKKNLTITNPEYAIKDRMHFWLGDTPKVLSLYEQQGNTLVLPFGTLRTLPECIANEGVFVSAFADAESVDYGGKAVPLYDYQKAAVEAVYRSQYGILQSPTGSGKTTVAIALVKKFGKRALWLTHTIDLLRQSKARAELYMDKNLIGTITGGKVNIGKGITFATIQTMCKLDLPRYKDLWDVIIVDEVQHVAGTPTAMTQFYKVLSNLAARHKYGLSATVDRADGMIEATYALLGRVVYEVPREAVGDKIMKVDIFPVGTGVEISRECLNTDGTKNYTKLITYLTRNPQRNKVILDTLVLNEGKSCLILSDRLDHLKELMCSLPFHMRKDAEMVSGSMTTIRDKAQREKAIEDMRTGKKKYLFATYALAREGLDIPRLERLFLTSPIKDYAKVVQSIGRIARSYEGKKNAIAYDFVDDMGYTVKLYEQRLRHYRKAGAYIYEKQNENL